MRNRQRRSTAGRRKKIFRAHGLEKYAAERLGDTVEMVHETYGHVTAKMRAGAVELLSALVTGATTGRSGSNRVSDESARRVPWL